MTQPQQQQQTPPERAFYISWPDSYWLTERKARTFFADAVANGEIEAYGLDADKSDIDDIVRWMHESGVITLTTYRS